MPLKHNHSYFGQTIYSLTTIKFRSGSSLWTSNCPALFSQCCMQHATSLPRIKIHSVSCCAIGAWGYTEPPKQVGTRLPTNVWLLVYEPLCCVCRDPYRDNTASFRPVARRMLATFSQTILPGTLRLLKAALVLMNALLLD